VLGGSRKTQVLFSPKTPNAKVGHLPTTPGMETATGMAPPKGEGVGWEAPLSYSSPTPLATGVRATPSLSGKRLRRSGRSRSVSTEAECHTSFKGKKKNGQRGRPSKSDPERARTSGLQFRKLACSPHSSHRHSITPCPVQSIRSFSF